MNGWDGIIIKLPILCRSIRKVSGCWYRGGTYQLVLVGGCREIPP